MSSATFTGSAGISPASSATTGQPSGRDARAPSKGLEAALRWFSNRIRLMLVLLCSLLAASAFAADKSLDTSRIGDNPVSLTEYFAILEDPGANLTLTEVQVPEAAARFSTGQAAAWSLNFGRSTAAYWLRLTLRNSSARPVDSMLEMTFPRLAGSVRLHQPTGDGGYATIDTGYLKPFATRPYTHRFYVFPVSLAANAEQVVYLRFQSPIKLEIPARLWARDAFHQYERRDYLTHALYFGMVLAMVAFNLLLFLVLRDANYLLYVAFVVCMALTLATDNGLAAEYLWGDSPRWVSVASMIGYCLSTALAGMFMRRMVPTATLVPRIDRLLKLLIGLFLLLPLGLALSYASFIRPTQVSLGLAMVLILITCAACAARGNRSAVFFLAAFGALLLAGIASTLRAFDILPSNFFTINGIQIGSALEMILLAIALADRFNQVRREKAEAQQHALLAHSETLKAQNDTLLAQAAAQQAQTEAVATQAQLAQSEKMAALGVLIAGVTHEINTPIGAIKSSGASITDALSQALGNLPILFQTLDHASMGLFLGLLNRANERAAPLSSRETRAVVAIATRQLEDAGIDGARHKAAILIKLNAEAALADYLPLLRHPESQLILDTASSMAAIIGSTHNINTAVDRVARIVLALKSFSRVNQSAEMIDASLQDGLETVLTIYNYQIKQHTDVVRNFEDIPPLRCLPDELNQVWTNLIHNALQAMDNGQPGTLTIGIRQEGSHAVVSVGDSGTGIPEEIRSKIFDVFFTTKPAGVGSGLGLDIVKKIIDKHHGRIEVQSKVGVGTTFLIYLPYAVPSS